MTVRARALLVVFGSILLVAIGAGFARVSSPLDGDADVDRRMRTAAVLNTFGHSLDGWVVLHGRAPSASEALSVLEDPSVSVKDGWGRPLIYKEKSGRDGRSFQLRSMGPNAQDDGGDGDDINYSPVAR